MKSLTLIIAATMSLSAFASTVNFANPYGETIAVKEIGADLFKAETVGYFKTKKSMSAKEAQKQVFQSASKDLRKHGNKICQKITGENGLEALIVKQDSFKDINVEYVQCESKPGADVCSSIALITFKCK